MTDSAPIAGIAADPAAAPKVSFVSLGCPKALVDSERIITQLRAEGYELSRSHAGADVVVVNTCGFLDSAKAESLDAIGKALAENGKVIVTGCMGAEPAQIRDAFPDVLAITGPQAYESVVGAVDPSAHYHPCTRAHHGRSEQTRRPYPDNDLLAVGQLHCCRNSLESLVCTARVSH